MALLRFYFLGGKKLGEHKLYFEEQRVRDTFRQVKQSDAKRCNPDNDNAIRKGRMRTSEKHRTIMLVCWSINGGRFEEGDKCNIIRSNYNQNISQLSFFITFYGIVN